MPEPFYSDTTERFYERIPGVYRYEDSQHNWQMKRWIAGLLEQMADVDVLLQRFRYVPPEDGPEVEDLSSDLVNPMTADAAWLAWLAQLVGVHFDYILTTDLQRTVVANAVTGVQAGTKAAIVQAAQTVLTGTKTVYVYPFSNNVGGIGAGGQWDVLVMTLAAETTGNVVNAIVNLGAKPAGVKLYHVTYGANWTTVETTLPTWADWETRTWQQIEQL